MLFITRFIRSAYTISMLACSSWRGNVAFKYSTLYLRLRWRRPGQRFAAFLCTGVVTSVNTPYPWVLTVRGRNVSICRCVGKHLETDVINSQCDMNRHNPLMLGLQTVFPACFSWSLTTKVSHFPFFGLGGQTEILHSFWEGFLCFNEQHERFSRQVNFFFKLVRLIGCYSEE